MNAVRCGFVCLSLGVLLVSAYVAAEWECQRDEQANLDAARWEPQRDERANLDVATIQGRILAKEFLVGELESDRLSLFEAAALFRDLDHVPPETQRPIVTLQSPDSPLQLIAPTEDERYCVMVISATRDRLQETQPDLVAIVTARLVAEFEAARGRSGAIRLPDSTSMGPAHVLLQQFVPKRR